MDESLFSNLPWRKYLRYSLLLIGLTLVGYVIIFFFTHTFYRLQVKASSAYDVTTLDAAETTDPVFTLAGIYAVPRDARVLTVTTRDATTQQSTQYMLAPQDLPIGFKELSLTLSPQHEVSSNGVNLGCSYGTYPNVLGYNCSDPSGLYKLTSDNYIDTPLLYPLPQMTIDAYKEDSTADEATLSVAPYKSGVLVLTTLISSDNKLNSFRLYYYDAQSRSEQSVDLPELQPGAPQYSLVTDSSGGESFGIFNPDTKSLSVYSSLGSAPTTIKPAQPTNQAEGVTCSINDSVVACYTGRNYNYSDSEEQNKYQSKEAEGTLATYDVTGKQLNTWKTAKDLTIQSVCYTRDQLFVQSDNDRLEVATPPYSAKLDFRTVFNSAVAFTCGKQPAYIYKGSIYRFIAPKTATMVYGNDALPARSISGSGDTVNFGANFPSQQNSGMSFSLHEETVPSDKKRTSDIVASVVSATKGSFYDLRFTPGSVEYILVDPSAQADLKNKLTSLSKEKGLPFAPTFPEPTLIIRSNN